MRHLAIIPTLFFVFVQFPAAAQIEEARLERRLSDGTIIKRHTLYVQPPFYKGELPVRYRSRAVASSSSGGFGFGDKVIWHEFDGWRNEFDYEVPPFVETVEAWSPEPRRLLARTEREKVDQERGLVFFRERHYSESGSVVFECVSVYHNQFKLEEIESKGQKNREFFFLLPLFG